jgi:hypothetical protein
MMTNPAEQQVVLPTVRLLAAAWVACLVAGGAWAGVLLVLGQGATAAVTGLVGAGAVAVAALVALLAIRPWRPRSLAVWPIVWVAGSMVRLLTTLGVAYLLYSATPYHSRMLWFAVLVAYLAALVGETRVYALSMRRFAPDGAGPSSSE